MRPQHMTHVVEAAWLLVALVFRQDDPCAAALQVSTDCAPRPGRVPKLQRLTDTASAHR